MGKKFSWERRMQAMKGHTCNTKLMIAQMSQPYPWDHLWFTLGPVTRLKVHSQLMLRTLVLSPITPS